MEINKRINVMARMLLESPSETLYRVRMSYRRLRKASNSSTEALAGAVNGAGTGKRSKGQKVKRPEGQKAGSLASYSDPVRENGSGFLLILIRS
jgi:hypothetical protein